MRTDPRIACANEHELFWWAILHDLIAHPFMALTFYSGLSLRFHDWTSRHAWPRNEDADEHVVDRAAYPVLEVDAWSPMKSKYVRLGIYSTTMEGFWMIDFGHRYHALTVKEETAQAAMKRGVDWLFDLEGDYGDIDHEPRFRYMSGIVGGVPKRRI